MANGALGAADVAGVEGGDGDSGGVAPGVIPAVGAQAMGEFSGDGVVAATCQDHIGALLRLACA